jgi:hypothetical protein
VPIPRERDRRGEAANAGAGDDDVARFTGQGRPGS